MSTLFGGMTKSRDLNDIVAALQENTMCNESAGSSVTFGTVNAIAENVAKIMQEHYADTLDPKYEHMIREDAADVEQLFKNNILENMNGMGLSASAQNESALMPNLVTLTASIATTMRQPYEAVLHRLFDTRTLEKQVVEIEEVIPTLRGPHDTKAEDLIDALAPYAPVPFVDRTEILVNELVNGVPNETKDMPVLVGMNPLFKVNRDLRVAKIEATYADGTAADEKDVRFAKGTVPFFDAKDNTLNLIIDIYEADGTVYKADLSAKFDFDSNVLLYLRGDKRITKVYFYATVSHAEHTHPIQTSFKNSFQQYVVPTRPHIEVSLPQETRTDISNSIHHFANTDVVTAMTDNITVISSRMEDQRLRKCIERGAEYEAEFPFEAPSNFAYGNLEWLHREFIPFLDQIGLAMKNRYNLTDCHFRVGVSPYILRILDTNYSMDKAMNEESRGSGVINYSIGVKTGTNVFYLISSQVFEDDKLRVLLIPNSFKMSVVKTYNYFKYTSFLTDTIRRSDNSVLPAIVYSERNLPIVFTPLSAKVTISEMPTMKTSGPRYIKRVTA